MYTLGDLHYLETFTQLRFNKTSWTYATHKKPAWVDIFNVTYKYFHIPIFHPSKPQTFHFECIFDPT